MIHDHVMKYNETKQEKNEEKKGKKTRKMKQKKDGSLASQQTTEQTKDE